MTYGDIIQDLRMSKGLSQQELADELKIGRSTLANYEQSKREPNYETLEKISRYFKVSVDYILGLTDKKNDYTHEHTLNEIVYKQLLILCDKDKAHHFNDNLYCFLDGIKDSYIPITEESIHIIAKLYDTNPLFLLGQLNDYQAEDPMEDNFDDVVRNKTKELFKDEQAIVDSYNNHQKQKYLNLRYNIAYNVLSELEITKIKNQQISELDSEKLLDYYQTIINYLKNSIKLIDLDKLVNSDQYYSQKLCLPDTPDLSAAVYDFFTYKDANSINSITTPFQFENYLLFLLKRHNFDNIFVTAQNTSYDIVAERNDQKFFFLIQYYSKKSNYKNMLIKKNHKNKNFIKSREKFDQYILILNVVIDSITRKTLLQNFDDIWDYEYLSHLESK